MSLPWVNLPPLSRPFLLWTSPPPLLYSVTVGLLLPVLCVCLLFPGCFVSLCRLSNCSAAAVQISDTCVLCVGARSDTWPAACQWQTENATFQFSGFYILSWNDVIRENDLFTILFFCALKCKNSLMCWFECFLLRLVVGLFAVGTRCLSGFHNKTSSAHSTESPIHSLFIPIESVLKPNQTEGE